MWNGTESAADFVRSPMTRQRALTRRHPRATNTCSHQDTIKAFTAKHPQQSIHSAKHSTRGIAVLTPPLSELPSDCARVILARRHDTRHDYSWRLSKPKTKLAGDAGQSEATRGTHAYVHAAVERRRVPPRQLPLRSNTASCTVKATE